jgi:tRNA threonylcarbamoyl adenosine modification protein YeaZ
VLVLALDTSTQRVCAGVVDADAVLAADGVTVANRHGELLAPMVRGVVEAAGARMRDLTAIVVGLGPGPFTGLRVGVVTAAGLADALGVPVYGCCSLDAMARPRSLVVTDARRRRLYWAEYDETQRRVDGPELATAAELADRFRGRVDVVVGPGAALYADSFDGFATAPEIYPHPQPLVALVRDRIEASAPSDVLTPIYLRAPDARPPGAPKQVTPA